MRLNQKLTIAGVTSLAWMVCLSSCGSLQIKTWFLDQTQVSEACKDAKPLIRRGGDGAVQEALTILQADGYRCYSPADDEAWRNDLNIETQCCNGKSSSQSLPALHHELTYLAGTRGSLLP